jgi:hypothetical protein
MRSSRRSTSAGSEAAELGATVSACPGLRPITATRAGAWVDEPQRGHQHHERRECVGARWSPTGPTRAADGKTESAEHERRPGPARAGAPSRARTAAEAGAERRGCPLEARVDPRQASSPTESGVDNSALG